MQSLWKRTTRPYFQKETMNEFASIETLTSFENHKILSIVKIAI